MRSDKLLTSSTRKFYYYSYSPQFSGKCAGGKFYFQGFDVAPEHIPMSGRLLLNVLNSNNLYVGPFFRVVSFVLNFGPCGSFASNRVELFRDNASFIVPREYLTASRSLGGGKKRYGYY